MAVAKRLISDVLGRGGIASSVLDGEAELPCVGMMEKKMETTIIMGHMGDYRVYVGVILGLYRGYIGIMEKKMETAM